MQRVPYRNSRNPTILPNTDQQPNQSTQPTPDTGSSILETLAQSARRGPLRWLAVAGILIAGNLANALSWRFAVPIDTGAFSVALALGLYATPGWGELRRSGVHALAWPWRWNWRSAALAVGAGLGLALPSVAFLAIAAAHGGVGSPIRAMPVPSLIMRELVEIPLLTAFLEELVFRQYVYRLFAQRSVVATVLVNAGLFTLWHLVVNARTVLDTTFAVSPLLNAGKYVGSLATVFAGGVVFALVRWRTGSFAYSAITHWVVVGLLTLAVWVL
jgi:membrane protease YdiL (CAAX protease family)